ncbi:hypothetical protein AeMF1_000182 [Aphanomyces euteiches]|nr:hypothetical protein AeMF1_000182 [Aphanomyces euteiches]KAH9195227.1 hypothetical protein AeNC1_002808 [Aphanomyces euteiches]
MLRELGAADFLAFTAAYRQADHIATNQIAGFAMAATDTTESRFWAVLEGDDVTGIAMFKPSRGVMLTTSVAPGDASILALDVVSSVDGIVVFITGSSASVQAFIEAYTRAHPCKIEAHWTQDVVLYAMDDDLNVDSRRFQGRMRLANAATDYELLIKWIHALDESIKALPRGEIFIHEGLKRQSLFIWEVEGVPVAFGGHYPAVNIGNERVVRLGPIFVDVSHRRKGYGSALTVAAIQHLRETSSMPPRFCLSTDASNVASNKAYLNIGFVMHSRSTRFGLRTAEEP